LLAYSTSQASTRSNICPDSAHTSGRSQSRWATEALVSRLFSVTLRRRTSRACQPGGPAFSDARAAGIAKLPACAAAAAPAPLRHSRLGQRPRRQARRPPARRGRCPSPAPGPTAVQGCRGAPPGSLPAPGWQARHPGQCRRCTARPRCCSGHSAAHQPAVLLAVLPPLTEARRPPAALRPAVSG